MKPANLIRNSLLTGVCIGLLTGCSWLGEWPPKNSETAAASVPKPPESKMGAADSGKWAQPAAVNADAASNGAQAGAMQPRGMNADSAAMERIAQLEQTVEQMRNDIGLMMPALTRLAQAQGDVQKSLAQIEPAAGVSAVPAAQPPVAITQLQASGGAQPGTVAWYEEQERLKRQDAGAGQVNIAGSPPAQQNAQAAVAPVQQPPAAYQPASYGTGQGISVTNVRFGEHPDKTRLVLDTSDIVAFSYDIDNSEQILTVSMPGTGWSGPAQMAVGNSPLVASYTAAPDNQGGQQLILQLKHPARVLWAQALMPGGPQGHRIVFDLAPL